MRTPVIGYGAVLSGLGSLITISFFSPTWWEIALAFPVGALTFLVVWVLGEKLAGVS